MKIQSRAAVTVVLVGVVAVLSAWAAWSPSADLIRRRAPTSSSSSKRSVLKTVVKKSSSSSRRSASSSSASRPQSSSASSRTKDPFSDRIPSSIVTALPGSVSDVIANVTFQPLSKEVYASLQFNFAAYATPVQSVLVYDADGLVGTATSNDVHSLFTLKFDTPLTVEANQPKSFYFRAVIGPVVPSAAAYPVHGVFAPFKDSVQQGFPTVRMFSSLRVDPYIFSSIANAGPAAGPFVARDGTTIASFTYNLRWSGVPDAKVDYLYFYVAGTDMVGLQNVRVRSTDTVNQSSCLYSNDWFIACPLAPSFSEGKPATLSLNLIADVKQKMSPNRQSLQIFTSKTKLSTEEMTGIQAAMTSPGMLPAVQNLLTAGTLWNQ